MQRTPETDVARGLASMKHLRETAAPCSYLDLMIRVPILVGFLLDLLEGSATSNRVDSAIAFSIYCPVQDHKPHCE